MSGPFQWLAGPCLPLACLALPLLAVAGCRRAASALSFAGLALSLPQCACLTVAGDAAGACWHCLGCTAALGAVAYSAVRRCLSSPFYGHYCHVPDGTPYVAVEDTGGVRYEPVRGIVRGRESYVNARGRRWHVAVDGRVTALDLLEHVDG